MMAKTPDFSLTFEGVDITREIASFLTDITYIDYLHGKSDSLSFTVEDRDGLWRGPWRPSRGNSFNLEIGYKGEKRMPSGSFKVDDIEYTGPPDVMRISGLAAAITRDLRTKRTRAFEEVTLKSIASQIADEQSLTLFGDVPNISFQRKTQNDETDLEFLNRLAEDYSLAFTVRDRTLIFHDIDTLERTNPLFTLERKNLKRYSLKEKSRNIFKAAEIQYLNPQEGQYLTHRYEVPGIQNGDTLMIKERVENLSQAEFRTIGALKEANRNLNRGSLTIPGNPMALSGVIFKLDDFGQISGNYLIEKAHHLSRRSSGYETKLDVRRVD